MTKNITSLPSMGYQPIPTTSKKPFPSSEYSPNQQSSLLASRSIEAVRSADMSQASNAEARGIVCIALGVLFAGITLGALSGIALTPLLALPVAVPGLIVLAVIAETCFPLALGFFSYGSLTFQRGSRQRAAINLLEKPIATKEEMQPLVKEPILEGIPST